jgi:hypothetical protein
MNPYASPGADPLARATIPPTDAEQARILRRRIAFATAIWLGDAALLATMLLTGPQHGPEAAVLGFVMLGLWIGGVVVATRLARTFAGAIVVSVVAIVMTVPFAALAALPVLIAFAIERAR